MKKLTKIALTTLAVGVAVKLVHKVNEIDKRTQSNIGKLSTQPGLSENDRLDNRINKLQKDNGTVIYKDKNLKIIQHKDFLSFKFID